MIQLSVQLDLDGAEGLDIIALHSALEDYCAGGTIYVARPRVDGEPMLPVPVVIDAVGEIAMVGMSDE
jgi:hypothetical protein